MEEILEKNIFNDKELLTLSPDFCPFDVILRMQMRRSSVKYPHTHKINRNHLQRKKTLKKVSSDISKNSQEIVKIKDTCEIENKSNNINLKTPKSQSLSKERANLKKYKNNGDFDNNQLKFETVFSETDFNYNDTEDLNNEIIGENAFNTENINEDQGIKVFGQLKDIKKNKDNFKNTEENETKTEDVLNDPVTDLQSILIRMAIFSNPQDDEIMRGNNSGEIENRENNKICNNETPDTKATFEPIKTEENTDFLKIKPLLIGFKVREEYLVKKYLSLWKSYVSEKRDFAVGGRKKALQTFFEKLEKNKNYLNKPCNSAKLNARDYNNYQHRYKVQKHIIALQKAKLEDQNRLIEELKYNKIVEASRHSVEAMREEVRRTYFEIDRHLKPKIKCLTNELKIPEIGEPSLVLHCLKVPQFLQRMEKRAREREEKHAIIRERRKQMEEERIRLKQQAEIAKVEMDNVEKMKRMIELKEKRKKEKIDNIRKKQHAERIRALAVMADLHYEKNILSRCGLKPWKELLQMKRVNMDKAKTHYEFQIVKNTFLHWMWYTEDMWYERNYKAEDFHRKKILRKYFGVLKMNHHEYVLLKQVAEDYYDFYVAKLVFRNFRLGIEESRKEHALKWQKAVSYHNSNVQFKIFTCWRSLPALNALQREQEARKARWREKVLQVVPDYTPPED